MLWKLDRYEGKYLNSLQVQLSLSRYHKFSLWLLANKGVYISQKVFEWCWYHLNKTEQKRIDKLCSTIKVT